MKRVKDVVIYPSRTNPVMLPLCLVNKGKVLDELKSFSILKSGHIMEKKISIPDTTRFNRCKEESAEGYSYTIWYCAVAEGKDPVTRFYCFQSVKRLNTVNEVVSSMINILDNDKSAAEALFAKGTPDFNNAMINEGNIKDDLSEENQIYFCGSKG